MKSIIYSLLIASLATGLLTGCHEEVHEGEVQQLQLVPYGASYAEAALVAPTRALPEGYELYSSMYPSSNNDQAKIAIYLVRPDANTCRYYGDFTHTTGDVWTSSVYVQSNTQYYLYGLMPAGCAECTVSSDDYAQGAKLTLSNMSPIIPTDVCVLTGVGSLGSFVYLSGEVEDVNQVTVLMDHLYSCINLQYAVDAEYNDLRTIRVKQASLQTLSGAKKLTVQVQLTDDAENPMSCILEGDGSTSGTTVALLSDEFNLQTTYQDITGFVAPITSTQTFNIITQYDVYDKQGTRVRSNCTATNTVTIPEIAIGSRVNLKLLVQPTYLYQLSDPDLDNPTIKVI